MITGELKNKTDLLQKSLKFDKGGDVYCFMIRLHLQYRGTAK